MSLALWFLNEQGANSGASIRIKQGKIPVAVILRQLQELGPFQGERFEDDHSKTLLCIPSTLNTRIVLH